MTAKAFPNQDASTSGQTTRTGLPVRRALLTGARGFIGRHCIEPLLQRGFEVHAISRSGGDQAPQEVCWHRADLLQHSGLTALLRKVRPSHLLHTAWYTEHGNFWNAPDNADWVRASLALGEAFAGIGGQRMVSAGSCAEYDWNTGCLHEATSALQPATFYGQCKHALNSVQSGYLERSGVSSSWARVFFPYGPGEPANKLVSSVIRSLLLGQPAACSPGDQQRDFVYVKDVAAALVQLLDSDVQQPVNIGTGRATRVRDVVDAIARQIQRIDLLRVGALPPRAGDPPLVVADIQRLRRDVGYEPRYDLESGIAETVEYWQHAAVRTP